MTRVASRSAIWHFNFEKLFVGGTPKRFISFGFSPR